MELEDRIRYYAEAYYNGNEIISDAEYDLLVEQLRAENPKSEILDTVISDGASNKVKLPITMGTLFKCNSVEELNEWIDKRGEKNYIAELKIDGAGFLLEYKDGKFVRAYSRGDSVMAEDSTVNVSYVQGVIKHLPIDFTGYIRGEVVMKTSVFEKEFAPKGFKNSRNATAGIMKRKDGTDCDKLNFIAYDAFDDNDEYDATETKKLQFLQSCSFEVPMWIMFKKQPTETLKKVAAKFREDTAKDRGLYPYQIDGIVLKQDSTDKDDLMKKTPDNNCAIKFDLTGKVSVIEEIEWHLSGKFLSPVALITPVDIDNRTISRVTLHNLKWMEEMGISIGAKVEVVCGGEVIPKISRVIS